MADQATNGPAKWTIMVYIAADPTLSNFAVESLKQLKAAADKDVVVAVQFDADHGYHGRKIRRLIFNGKGEAESSIKNNYVEFPEIQPAAMTESSSLADFINWVYTRPECHADRRCLILWGHGPELLFAPSVRRPKPDSKTTGSKTGGHQTSPYTAGDSDDAGENGTARLYFTPIQLADALKKAKAKFNIIGLDACSMSMIEYAYELHDLADFMIASQEEVPDFSFPYGALVKRLRDHKGTVADFCKATVECYENAYQDYVFNSQTEIAPVTLSALRLGKIDRIAGPLKELVDVLQLSALDSDLAEAIYQARQGAHGFVGGVFVDLYDFCDRLKSSTIPGVKQACRKVSEAISDRDDETACVVANGGAREARQDQSNGLSIYFPYLREKHDKEQVERRLVKGPGGDTIGKLSGGNTNGGNTGGNNNEKGPGGDTIGKGPGGDTIGKNVDIINTAATNALYAIRRKIIKDTEDYYRDKQHFKFAEATGWYEFIRRVWCRILAEKEPDELDVRYSAQQCAANLLYVCGQAKTESVEPKKEAGPEDSKPLL